MDNTKKADLNSLRIDRSEKSYNPDAMRTSTKLIIGAGVIAVLIIIFLTAKNLFDPAVEVKLTTAVIQTPSQTNASLSANGYVVAQRKAAVASKGTGRLVYLGVVEGDQVKKDQVIGRLEDNDIRAMLESAKSNLKLNEADLKDAENNYKRLQSLFKTGSSSQLELDAAESRYLRVLAGIEVAKANLRSQEVALENTLIRAPFDGTVLTKNAEIGEIVAPFAASVTSRGALVTMADMKSLQVEADVSESNIEKIMPDQECEIVLDAYPMHSYKGYVTKIVPTADRGKATVMVKVAFKNYDSKVLPEMSAKVVFLGEKKENEITDEKPALIVPFTSVVKRNNKDVVFIVRDDKAVEVPVKIGRQFNTYVEITAGISDGDKVIEKPVEDLKTGSKVKVS